MRADAVHKQRYFIQQACVRMQAFNHDTVGVRTQPDIFVVGKFASRIDYYGRCGFVGINLFEHVEAADIREIQIKHDTFIGSFS